MKLKAVLGLLAVALLVSACASDDAERPTSEPAEAAGLSEFELEHGIGPFTEEVVLPAQIDHELAELGKDIYQMNCEACHQMEGRLVGPPLGGVLARRSPTFIMNMIMNPEQMAREHPEGQAMLAQYPVVMPYQNISEDQARAILEYLRTEQR